MTKKLPATYLFILLILPCISYSNKSKLPNKKKDAIIWKMAELPGSKLVARTAGSPSVIPSPNGRAIHFNGIEDGFFIEDMPLSELPEFTIEVVFSPESGGNFEQRFFHTGEIRGNRVLLELRSTPDNWYLDAYIKSGDHQMTLIEPAFLHPLGQWYHIAFVVDHGELTTWVNKRQELSGKIEFAPLLTGKTSIGVRQNEQSWFKGSICTIKISPKALKPSKFMKF